MLFTNLNAITTLGLAFFVSINALPINHEQFKRDVFVPPVLYPNAETHWYTGQTHNVTWSTENAPKSISNGAQILLRFQDIETPVILAQDFDLRAGRTEITVPWVLSGTNYSVVLFGDSGNWSPAFSIN